MTIASGMAPIEIASFRVPFLPASIAYSGDGCRREREAIARAESDAMAAICYEGADLLGTYGFCLSRTEGIWRVGSAKGIRSLRLNPVAGLRPRCAGIERISGHVADAEIEVDVTVRRPKCRIEPSRRIGNYQNPLRID